MDILTSLSVGIISQCVCISKHKVVHRKYIQFSFVNYFSLNLGKKKQKKSIDHTQNIFLGINS